MSTIEHIQAASARNISLLQTLQQTDHSTSALSQQTSYIADLKSQLSSTQSQLAKAKAATQSELKDHEKYRDSTFRRFAHKASGKKEKFAEKAEKEEREYFDAVQAQKSAEDRVGYIEGLLREAEAAKAGIEPEVTRHTEAQKELDSLYQSIFSGRTPEFPAEDAIEERSKAAEGHFGQVSRAMDCEKQATATLIEARKMMGRALQEMGSARGMSQWDMFGGGTMASMMKRNALENAQAGVGRVQMLVDQARRTSPHVGEIGPLNVASGSIWGDVVFDNIFSDMQMHEKITQSEMGLQKADQQLKYQIQKAQKRQEGINKDLKQAREALDAARGELQKTRQEIFQRVSQGGEQPPPYQA